MSLLAFFGTLNLILLSRLWLTFKDEGADPGTIIKMSLVPLLSLIFVETGLLWFLVLATLLLSPVVMYLTEKSSANIYQKRELILLLHVAALGLIFGFVSQTGLNGRALELVLDNPLFSAGEIITVNILMFGGLLVMNEMNIVLRYLMFTLNLAPIGRKKSQSNITDQQYNTGRVIGMLERIFIYSFAISGQFAAIGFILTAKGVVRYHEFEDRAFAEYVLIGTLLSALLAMAVALVVKSLV